MTQRRFPPPWTLDEANDACFIVKDHNGHALAYVYFELEPGRRTAANLLTDQGRSPAHRRQHRQTAGADEAAGLQPDAKLGSEIGKKRVLS